MNSLKLIPFSGAPAVEKSMADWRIAETFDGAFRSLVPDELNLRLPKAALADPQFNYRDRIQIKIDGKTFFSGYVSDDVRIGDGAPTDEAQLKISGPCWYLENLPYRQKIQKLIGYDVDNNPIYEDAFLTHFTLNLPQVANFIPAGGTQVLPSVFYTVQQLHSRAQIKDILDFAIARGAWLQYDDADILDEIVLPRTVMNISCADAIRAQLEDVDAVAWFDHTQDPPKFYCKRRKDLPAFSRALGDAHEVPGFSIKQRFDLAVPSVVINFEQQVSIGGVSYIQTFQDFWPAPLPADELKALITTVPLRSISGTIHEQYIKTETVDPESLDWWKRRKPEMSDEDNYADLELLSWTRQTLLPRMIVDGAYCDWMGGVAADDDIIGKFSFHRKQVSGARGTVVKEHLIRANCTVTDLNVPNGLVVTATDYSSNGEDISNFIGLAKTIYEDLNPASGQWEGTIPLWEKIYSGDITLGKNLNLDGGRADWETMNALVQEIGFKVRSGSLNYTCRIGPNKKLSAQQLADRLRLARVRYQTVFTFSPTPSTSRIRLARKHRSNSISESQPAISEQNVNEPLVADPTKQGNIRMSGNAGDPFIQAGLIKDDGSLDPAQGSILLQPVSQIAPADVAAGTGALQIRKVGNDANGKPVYIAATGIPDFFGLPRNIRGSDGNMHPVDFREIKIGQLQADGTCKQRSMILICCNPFQGAGDPN